MSMPDNDNLTYSPPKRGIGFDVNGTRLSERILLTPDRAQKLDLLIHLLTNLKQPLIVSGPEGIGKTTLLRTLESSRNDIWPICFMQGSAELSFETVIMQLGASLKLGSTHFDMPSLRKFCERRKVILLIDDANRLVAGLISELIEFAESLFGLRLVFSMNYDEFRQNTNADSTVEKCHVIELPPLTQRQCLEYLQNLTLLPDTQLAFEAITDSLVEDLYQKTQGIPGKLLTMLPRLDEYQTRHKQKLGLWIGSTLIVVVAGLIGKQLLPSKPVAMPLDEATTPSPQAVDNNATAVFTIVAEPAVDGTVGDAGELASETREVANTEPSEAAQAAAPNPIKPADNTETDGPPEARGLEIQSPQAADSAQTEFQIESPSPEAEQTVETQPPDDAATAPIIANEPPINAQQSRDAGDRDWIMAQPADNYTVQVMVLSKKDSIERFIQKHADYRDNLKYYPIGQAGHEKYVLLFGSFHSAADALKRKSTMPDEFQAGMVKSFARVQRQSRH